MNVSLFPEVYVNDTKIASAAIAAEAQNHAAPQGKPGLAWRMAARALIMRELLFQEADRLGIEEPPSDLGQGRRETEEEARIRGLLDVVIDNTAPAEDAVREVWARDPDRYRAPTLWEVSHILCAADPANESALAQAKLKADVLTAEVTKTPKSFGRIAKAESECSSSAEGGVLGQLGPGDTVPEFETVLRVLSEGEITSQPILTRFGYHIVRLDACAHGRVLPFESVRPKLAEAMEKADWTKAVQSYTKSLVAAANITGIDLEAF